jgi:hypothetical protein
VLEVHPGLPPRAHRRIENGRKLFPQSK